MWMLGAFIGLSVAAMVGPDLLCVSALMGVAAPVLAASHFVPLQSKGQ